jgi:hypothetical protein
MNVMMIKLYFYILSAILKSAPSVAKAHYSLTNLGVALFYAQTQKGSDAYDCVTHILDFIPKPIIANTSRKKAPVSQIMRRMWGFSFFMRQSPWTGV